MTAWRKANDQLFEDDVCISLLISIVNRRAHLPFPSTG